VSIECGTKACLFTAAESVKIPAGTKIEVNGVPVNINVDMWCTPAPEGVNLTYQAPGRAH